MIRGYSITIAYLFLFYKYTQTHKVGWIQNTFNSMIKRKVYKATATAKFILHAAITLLPMFIFFSFSAGKNSNFK